MELRSWKACSSLRHIFVFVDECSRWSLSWKTHILLHEKKLPRAF